MMTGREPLVILRDELHDSVEFWFNGNLISSVNHDDHGWASMGVVEEALTNLADALGVEIEVREKDESE